MMYTRDIVSWLVNRFGTARTVSKTARTMTMIWAMKAAGRVAATAITNIAVQRPPNILQSGHMAGSL